MAKPRKQKTEDQRPEHSGAVVRHQKLCISIDMSRRCIYGYTELKVVVPETGRVGLHADNMTIDHISVDGEPVNFEFFQHHQVAEDDRRWSSVSCTSSSADAACSAYISFLDKEMAPNLFISCHKSVKSASDPQQQANGEDNSLCLSSGGSQDDTSRNNGHVMHENVKTIRIDYWVDKAETGIHFEDKMLHTNSQIRRACCWFPCIDSSLQRCCYDLEFTVDSDLVAVSNGTLLYQVLNGENPPRKTYVYRLNVPVTARWISLAVAPFEVLPDSQNSMLTHICLPSSISKLRNTVGFFYSTFSHYEEYLSASFPFGSYTHVFITPEMAVTSMSLGASMCIFSSHVLFDEKIIDQTIGTRVKLAYALARQWFGVFITAEEPNDEWLLDGLAGFLTDSFIKRFLGNNEARYCRYKANCAVCKADVNGLTALSSSAASSDLYGTQCIGFYGKIRSWKAVSILQMLEKQMGPESFRKILQNIISRAKNTTRSLRTLSTKEFRRLANKVGNLERPFLKEFFPRWVGSCGCPVLRMGFSYNKRRNMIELAVLRGCTAPANSTILESNGNPDTETREVDVGWPGMMSIRVHELDGMYDHPILPMAGETCQVLEIQCHSKLSAKRIQKSKKGSKPDGSDDNVDMAPALDVRSSAESPLLWVRVDPELEYLAEIQFHQPVQMWINQLEKDKDVVAQSQAIAILESLPHHSFSVVSALNNFLTDSKAFWRVRIEAAFALAHTASEENDYAGLLHLIKFYKSRRFDSTIGLPRPNNFHDFSEYFVLKAIPQAIAMVRGPDQNSPREAVEFIAELLKYNDNNGNSYSDVYWLAAIVQSIGSLEFGQQSMQLLSSLLKRIDRLLQFDRLMPSYNGILTVSCLHTLTQIALKFSTSLIHDRVFDLIKPFRNFEKAIWQVRIEASRALLDLEFYCKGIDEALSLFIAFIEEEPSLRGQVKLAVHMMHLCQMKNGSITFDMVKSSTLVALLCQLESHRSFNNVFLRHHLFCILQILSGRSPTLYGVPRVKVQPVVNVEHSTVAVEEPTVNVERPTVDAEHPTSHAELPTVDVEHPINHAEHPTVDVDACSEPLESEVRSAVLKLKVAKSQETAMDTPQSTLPENLPVPEHPKDADTVSNGTERKSSIVKIRVKPQGAASGRVDDINAVGGAHNENEVGPTSSVSVDAPPRMKNGSVSPGHLNFEEANSHECGSRMTASIGSAKFLNDNETIRELQCTADSRKGGPVGNLAFPSFKPMNAIEAEVQMHTPAESHDRASLAKENRKEKKEKKEKKKEKKRKREEKAGEKDHHEDPEYLERKHRKKEKKQREKEMEKLKSEAKACPEDLHGSGKSIESNMQATTSLGPRKSDEMIGTKAEKSIEESRREVTLADPRKLYEKTRSKEENSVEAGHGTNKSSALKIRIKFKK